MLTDAQRERLGSIEQKLNDARVELAEIDSAEPTPNADEAAIIANWESVSGMVDGLLTSVSNFLHKLG